MILICLRYKCSEDPVLNLGLGFDGGLPSSAQPSDARDGFALGLPPPTDQDWDWVPCPLSVLSALRSLQIHSKILYEHLPFYGAIHTDRRLGHLGNDEGWACIVPAKVAICIHAYSATFLQHNLSQSKTH